MPELIGPTWRSMDTRQKPGKASDYEHKPLNYKDFSWLAERVGFEPTCRNYPTIRFRVGAVVTTSVPLRRNNLMGPEPQRDCYSSGT